MHPLLLESTIRQCREYTEAGDCHGEAPPTERLVEAVVQLASSPPAQPVAPPSDLLSAATLALWNRFAPEHRATFAEEPHKDEYRFAAEEVIALVRKDDSDYGPVAPSVPEMDTCMGCMSPAECKKAGRCDYGDTLPLPAASPAKAPDTDTNSHLAAPGGLAAPEIGAARDAAREDAALSAQVCAGETVRWYLEQAFQDDEAEVREIMVHEIVRVILTASAMDAMQDRAALTPERPDESAARKKCLYCACNMIAGSECLSKAQSESCGMLTSAAAPTQPYDEPPAESVPTDADQQWIGDMMILQVLADTGPVNDQERAVLQRWLVASQPPSKAAPQAAPDALREPDDAFIEVLLRDRLMKHKIAQLPNAEQAPYTIPENWRYLLGEEPDALRESHAELIEALEVAKNGLAWYRAEFPDVDSPADDEAREQVDAALTRANGVAHD